MNDVEKMMDTLQGQITSILSLLLALAKTHNDKERLIAEFNSLEQTQLAVFGASMVSDTVLDSARQLSEDLRREILH